MSEEIAALQEEEVEVLKSIYEGVYNKAHFTVHGRWCLQLREHSLQEGREFEFRIGADT